MRELGEICLITKGRGKSSGTKFTRPESTYASVSFYALLGVEFVSNQTSELLVNIKLNDSNGPSYNSEIELNEEIFWGIPSEYANSIINSAKEKLSNQIGSMRVT